MGMMEFQSIDRHFADFLAGKPDGDFSPRWLAAALVSRAVREAHICLYLEDPAETEMWVEGKAVWLPDRINWRNRLREWEAVGRPGDFRPLILDEDDRLYLYRYWKYERDLADFLLSSTGSPARNMDGGKLEEGLLRLFPKRFPEEPDRQREAAEASVRNRFCVISGGPGTGKTTTVVRILALLLEQAGDRPFRIALAAPTGKSAAKLNESIRATRKNLNCSDAILERIPEEVPTIHRLLGPVRGSIRFRHSRDNPLPCDAVVIDEASMVALPLMTKLVAALRPEARLILLGDKDQLASVEAGAVLGDICHGGRLASHLVVLEKNYRFDSHSGIGRLGRMINEGNGVAALALLKDPLVSDGNWMDLPDPSGMKQALLQPILEGYAPVMRAQTPDEALCRFDGFRILCALRRSTVGVAAINLLVEEILAENGLIDPNSRWYRGRPVMITVNDYGMKLYNGDIGMVWPDGEGRPRVFFPAPGGGLYPVSPLRLPRHETVYSMTVHKSQGSEFDRVILMLPDHDSDLMTRELLYTGITRAKGSVSVWGTEAGFVAAVSRKIDRKSGLRAMLGESVDGTSVGYRNSG